MKSDIMMDAHRATFGQHEALKALLVGTGEARIVEQTSRDASWGDGGDGSGLNTRGEFLLRLRSELRSP